VSEASQSGCRLLLSLSQPAPSSIFPVGHGLRRIVLESSQTILIQICPESRISKPKAALCFTAILSLVGICLCFGPSLTQRLPLLQASKNSLHATFISISITTIYIVPTITRHTSSTSSGAFTDIILRKLCYARCFLSRR
jgi:hypothetical protein